MFWSIKQNNYDYKLMFNNYTLKFSLDFRNTNGYVIAGLHFIDDIVNYNEDDRYEILYLVLNYINTHKVDFIYYSNTFDYIDLVQIFEYFGFNYYEFNNPNSGNDIFFMYKENNSLGNKVGKYRQKFSDESNCGIKHIHDKGRYISKRFLVFSYIPINEISEFVDEVVFKNDHITIFRPRFPDKK